jgi:hypothetical protein
MLQPHKLPHSSTKIGTATHLRKTSRSAVRRHGVRRAVWLEHVWTVLAAVRADADPKIEHGNIAAQHERSQCIPHGVAWRPCGFDGTAAAAGGP